MRLRKSLRVSVQIIKRAGRGNFNTVAYRRHKKSVRNSMFNLNRQAQFRGLRSKIAPRHDIESTRTIEFSLNCIN